MFSDLIGSVFYAIKISDSMFISRDHPYLIIFHTVESVFQIYTFSLIRDLLTVL